MYQIQTPRPTYALRHAAVTVCLDAQDRLSIFYKHKPLAFTLFQQQAKQSQIVDTKQLNQAVPNHHKPAPDHPWRKGYPASPSNPKK